MNEPPQLTKPILSNPDKRREWAAWALLAAVEKLFPERIEELRDLEDEAEWQACPIDVEKPTDEQIQNELTNLIGNWAERNRISCHAVESAAFRLVFYGASGPQPDIFGDLPLPEPLLRVQARPTQETREEFLKRAAEHYDTVVGIFIPDDVSNAFHEPILGLKRSTPDWKKGPVKKGADSLSEHFLFLAAHRVGRYPVEKLASDERPFPDVLPLRQLGAVAEGIRVTARLLGLPPLKAGRPKGSQTRRTTRHRASGK